MTVSEFDQPTRMLCYHLQARGCRDYFSGNLLKPGDDGINVLQVIDPCSLLSDKPRT
jgi:hypothetical protein